ncbi:MAG: HEAT repeat domain-containing protein [Leptodesmis sp.]|uniref:HEAT repeat domain-containing protein n=1 Tax=Leptodesmis sp. TaxID=3100501 RepID=UPI003D11B3ED
MNRWLRCWLPTIAALATLPLLATVSNGQSACTSDALKQAVAQLQDPQRRAGAQKRLQECGETAVKPLTDALNNPVANTRLYAAQTLGQIGWEAKAAVPILVSTVKGDANTQVRHNAVSALNLIVQGSQKASEHWQGWQIKDIQQLQTLKQQLDDLRTGLEKDKKAWQTKAADLETLRLASQQLQTQINSFTDRPTYQIVSWGQSHLWIVFIGAGAIALVTAYGTIFWV